MANYSSINIYHPIQDFSSKDQEYFKKYYEAEQETRKAKPKEGWIGLSYNNFVADYIGLPPKDENDSNPWSRIQKYASFRQYEDGTLLVHLWGYKHNTSLGHFILDFSEKGRNYVPSTWRIACMSGAVDAGCVMSSDGQPFCYASINISLVEAINNVERYLNAAYKLPVTKELGVWAYFSQFCGKLEEFGKWLARHYVLSIEPEKCLVVLDWGEVAFFYCEDKEMKKAAENKPFIKVLRKLEAATTSELALKFIGNYQSVKNITVELIKEMGFFLL